MANIIQGNLVGGSEKYCIIIARFNEFIGSKLLSGAIDELVRHGVGENNIDVHGNVISTVFVDEVVRIWTDAESFHALLLIRSQIPWLSLKHVRFTI